MQPSTVCELCSSEIIPFAVPGIALAGVGCGCKIVRSVAVNALNSSMCNCIGDALADGSGNDTLRSFYSNRVLSHESVLYLKLFSTFAASSRRYLDSFVRNEVAGRG